MKKTISILLTVCLTFPALLTGCKKVGANAAPSNEVRIGVYEPITGANGAGGSLELEGIKLANEMYPEVLGKKVKLYVVDNKSDKSEAANAVERLIDEDGVSAIIGSWGSSLSMAGGPVAQKAKVPVVGASCTNPNVTKANDYYFRVCFLDPFQGEVMAKYIYNNVHAKKVAIIQEVSNDYSVGLASYFTQGYKKLTGDENSIAGKPLNYNTGDQDFTAQLTAVKSMNPDAIFAPGNFTESALLIKQARQLGITVPIYGGDTWETDEFLKVGGSAVDGAVFSTFFAADKPVNAESKKYIDAYYKKYNKEPAAVGALGYDAYLVILNAIKNANSTDPVKIRDEIAKTKNFPGATGNITIGPDRNAIKAAIIKKVVDGKFKYLDTIEPDKQ